MSANVPERQGVRFALESNSAFFSSGISASESFLILAFESSVFRRIGDFGLK
jgi:hypothetical protein